jgi:hypothetical protein
MEAENQCSSGPVFSKVTISGPLQVILLAAPVKRQLWKKIVLYSNAPEEHVHSMNVAIYNPDPSEYNPRKIEEMPWKLFWAEENPWFATLHHAYN